jgi:hypothetical protein
MRVMVQRSTDHFHEIQLAQPSKILQRLLLLAAGISEVLANLHQSTRRYNPEDSHLRTHRRENLKSYVCSDVFKVTGNQKTNGTVQTTVFLF